MNSLTDDDEIDNSAAGNDDDKPIKWSPTSGGLTVPDVAAQGAVSPDGLAATPASDGRATIEWRMIAQQNADTTPLPYTRWPATTSSGWYPTTPP